MKPSLVALTLAAACLVAACRPAEPPPIVVISIDTLRADRLPAYDRKGGAITPAIDRLAADGVLFERAFAQVPLTLPSHTSLFTGLLPPASGVRDNVGFSLAADVGRTLAERLGDHGYRRGGAVSAFVLRQETGISRGFENWDAPEAAERPGRDTLTRVLPWLTSWQRDRFLLFFHIYEPHAPYAAPAEIAARYADAYDGEVATADGIVGELLGELDRLGLYDRALIVLLSDHGEGLGDHGEDEHGFLLYREAIHVPLVVKLPGKRRAGERIRDAVGLHDVLPTLLAAAGMPTDPALPGHDLLAPREEKAPPIYSETWATFVHFGWSELLSAVDGRFHYIEGPKPELYDLDADPGETRNLLLSERRAGRTLRDYLGTFPRELAPPKQETDPETVAKLNALGYLAGGPSGADTGGPKLNPRDELPGTAPVFQGMRLLTEGRAADAIALLEPAVAANPDLMLGWMHLGRAYQAVGRTADAKAAFAHTMHGAQRESFLAVSAAMRLMDLGRVQQALDVVHTHLRKTPNSPDLHVVESRALMMLGRHDEALAAADAAVAADAKLADARYQRAVVYLTRGEGAAAESDLRAAIALEPRHLQATKALAVVRFNLGDPAEAKRLLERALVIAPGDTDATQGLAMLAQARP